MDGIHIQEISGVTASESEVEIVERKGLGHPDTICDLVMEQISQQLSRAYTASFGRILHHNCDKGLLVAGQVERSFGGGRVIGPMKLVIGTERPWSRNSMLRKLPWRPPTAGFTATFPISKSAGILFTRWSSKEDPMS
jgi:S-adenosylmethionine synthetase